MDNRAAAATETAREWMIQHQVRPWDVSDERVLRSLARVQREAFVPPQWHELAFADTELPLPCGQSMLKPVIEGRLLQALQTQPRHNVLLIGTGSGYVAACLAKLAARVIALDIHAELTTAAAERLEQQRIRNVTVQTGDFNDFQPEQAFDRILITGSMPFFDVRLPEWLKADGRAVVITGTAPAMQVEAIQREGNSYSRQRLFETVVPVLENVPMTPAFTF